MLPIEIITEMGIEFPQYQITCPGGTQLIK